MTKWTSAQVAETIAGLDDFTEDLVDTIVLQSDMTEREVRDKLADDGLNYLSLMLHDQGVNDGNRDGYQWKAMAAIMLALASTALKMGSTKLK
jgi:hypothetical protein